ncbi:DegT/DnrJ/EryC1/StrS family aminotransferase [Cellulomonas xylanilytica]|uniref:Aminotransferase n=1 Tax=Cellulomonas xylanilytica TaxID=233583 RepID=A0A510V449_9CELL|nr:DegT/DnrJ/EryC1/StrS family aminotransferase [Cellulomonas xylanilytica]GEK21654.1 aminotransferase [Cellulomonas xylanilytica]
MIPISSVELGPEVEAEVLKVLRSGMIAQGPVVAEFERRFAKLTGVKHAVAVNNGTTALVAALQVQDLEPGDEVVTSPFTFVATLNAILEAGATATFADIRDEDFNLDPAATEAALTDRTRVVMPVHLYGQTVEASAFTALAERRGLVLVEDSAQSHGATFEGRAAGSFGIGCFSFYGTKNLTTGEGGIITTDDDGIADRLRVLRNQGMRARYQYEVAGHNYRLTDLQAAVVLPQLDRYAAKVADRRANAAALIEGLQDVPGLVVPRQLAGREHVWHQFTVRVTTDAAVSRDELVARLTEAGVGSGIYYPKLVFDYETYRNHPRVRISDVPVAAQVVTEVVSLPVHPRLSGDDVQHVVESVRKILGA